MTNEGSIDLVTRRTKKMSWRRHKRWLQDRLIESAPMDRELPAWLYRAACERAKFLRVWYGCQPS